MKLQLINVRLAFPALFEPKTVNGEGEPAFSAAFIFAKDHPCVKELNAAIDTVAKEKWGPKAGAILTTMRATDKLCLHSGDTKTQYDGYEGNLFVSSRNKVRPLVIDRNKSPLTAADGRPYAGCYVVANIELWAQDNNYGKRINATLRGVQFYADGDSFVGGGSASEDEFADLGEGAEADIF